MRITNYPPLFLRLVAAVAPRDEGILTTGSLISLAGFWVTMALVGCCASQATGDRRSGILAALLLGGTSSAAYHASSCAPDALGLCLVTAGVTWASLRLRGWPIGSGTLFALALITKHSLISLPVGTCLWALWRYPRSGALLVLSFLVLVGSALGFGGLFRPLVLQTVAPWSLTNFLVKALWMIPLLPGMVISGRLIRTLGQLPQPARQVLEPWGAGFVATLLCIVSLGRVGSGANYLLELAVVCSLLTTVAATYQGGRFEQIVCPAVLLLFGLGWCGFHMGFLLPAMHREMQLVKSALEGKPGAVLAEHTWYTTALGRPPLIIPYLARQLALAGKWNPGPLLEVLRRGEVAHVVLSFPVEEDPVGGHADRLPPGALETIRAHYRLVAHTDGVFIYQPLAPDPARSSRQAIRCGPAPAGRPSSPAAARHRN